LTPQNLINQLQATYTVKLVVASPLTETQLASLNGGGEFVQALDTNAYLLRLKNTPDALDSILDEIVRSNISLEHLEITPVTLEDVFLSLTGNELRD
jgi:ABC-type multidrug transport system ATPase subunit